MITTFRYVKAKPQIHCEGCEALLTGRSAWFTHCDTCSNQLLTEPTERWFFCKLHPDCGCSKPSECKEES